MKEVWFLLMMWAVPGEPAWWGGQNHDAAVSTALMNFPTEQDCRDAIPSIKIKDVKPKPGEAGFVCVKGYVR